MKTKGLSRPVILLGLFIASIFLASCRTEPIRLQSVGPPKSISFAPGGTGYLAVYSETKPKRLDKGPPYYLHTSYIIQNESGQKVKWVPNHVGDMDQQPQVISLPAGKYEVIARSTSYGLVHVPVIVSSGQKTEVHLDGYWKLPTNNLSARDLVSLPDGEIVGWLAQRTPNSN